MKRTWIMGMVSGLVVVLTGWTVGVSRTQSQQAQPAAAPSASKEPSTQGVNDAFVQKINMDAFAPSSADLKIVQEVFAFFR